MVTEDDTRDVYKSLGQKLKSMEEESKRKSREIIQKELKTLGFQPYLPHYLRNRLLNLRELVDLPLLNVSPEVFEKRGLLSRRQYYSRLATLVTDVGLAYQRAHLKYPRIGDISWALKKTFNLDIPTKDIENTLALLEDLRIIRKVDAQTYEFEPLSISKHVSEIIAVATVTWKREKRGCIINDFIKSLSLDVSSIEVILNDLEKQGLCRKIDDEYWFVGIDEG